MFVTVNIDNEILLMIMVASKRTVLVAVGCTCRLL